MKGGVGLDHVKETIKSKIRLLKVEFDYSKRLEENIKKDLEEVVKENEEKEIMLKELEEFLEKN
jgi:hypothetical protein